MNLTQILPSFMCVCVVSCFVTTIAHPYNLAIHEDNDKTLLGLFPFGFCKVIHHIIKSSSHEPSTASKYLHKGPPFLDILIRNILTWILKVSTKGIHDFIFSCDSIAALELLMYVRTSIRTSIRTSVIISKKSSSIFTSTSLPKWNFLLSRIMKITPFHLN